jgi:sporulation protein YlmC with PRC-barrel domain
MSLMVVGALLLGACAAPEDDNVDATLAPGEATLAPEVESTLPPDAEATLAPDTEDGALVVKSSALAGTDVLSSTGDDVGEVSHALVDAEGNIQFVVFDVGGFLGVGERVVAVPWGSFEVVPDDTRPHLVYGGTQADLEAMPEMDDVDLDAGQIDANGTDFNGLVALGQSLTDFNVVDANGEDLGEVEDVIIDLQNGTAVYGLVDFGGFLGLAENTVAVPWQRMEILAGEDGEPNDTVFQLDVNEETLRNAPVFDENNWTTWPDPADPNWDTDIRSFWDTVA